MSQPLSTYTYIQADDIKRFAYDAFKAVDLDEQSAALTADALWLTSLRGVDSHGIRLLPHYVTVIETERVNRRPNKQFTQTAPATGVFDADHAIGHSASILAMRHAIELAQTTGVSVVIVKNSTHNGSLGPYGLEAARNDMIGVAMTGATTYVNTPNSTRPYFGTNPICFAAPLLNEDPLCYDAAPTPFTGNKVAMYREDGKPLPEGIAADRQGQPTTSIADVAQLIPIGGYKGFGLLLMVDMFSSMLVGMPSGDQVTGMFGNDLAEKRFLGHFFMAIRISAFHDLDEFKGDLQNNVDKIRQQPRMNADVPVYAPGDPEKAQMKQRMKQGIPVKAYDMERFHDLATRLKIKPPQPI